MAAGTLYQDITKDKDYKQILNESEGNVTKTLRLFQSKFPQKYTQYQKYVYPDPSKDPWLDTEYKKAEKRAENIAKAKGLTGDKYEQVYQSELLRLKTNIAKEFAEKNPEKAKEYAKNDPYIRDVIQ